MTCSESTWWQGCSFFTAVDPANLCRWTSLRPWTLTYCVAVSNKGITRKRHLVQPTNTIKSLLLADFSYIVIVVCLLTTAVLTLCVCTGQHSIAKCLLQVDLALARSHEHHHVPNLMIYWILAVPVADNNSCNNMGRRVGIMMNAWGTTTMLTTMVIYDMRYK